MVARRVAAAFCAALLPACFDIEIIDPDVLEPLLLDDFEDGDTLPSSSKFGRWQCYRFNPDTDQGISCDLEPGYQSEFALFAQFTIEDPPDGTQQFAGAGLATYALSETVDFGAYRQLAFNARLEGGDLPNGTQLTIELGCNAAPLENPAIGGDRYVNLGVALSGASWSTSRLALTSFGQPSWLTNHIVGGARTCLGLVDAVRFTVGPNLMDGQSASGRLHIDGVQLL